MSEFIGNSNVSKMEEKEKIAPITTNVVVNKNKNVTKKFFAEDAKSVGSHVFEDVIIPSIQKILSDSVKNAIDWLLYGTKGSSYVNNTGIRRVSFSDYNSFYNRPNVVQQTNSYPAQMSQPKANVFTVNDVIFNDRGETEVVLQHLKDIVLRYGMASVGDFYDMINEKSDYTAQKWGWRNLDQANVIRRGNGFSIDFPKITSLE